MTLSRSLVTGVIVVVILIVLVSLAYPSVQAPVFSTVTIQNTSTSAYPITLSTLITVPYGTSTLTSISYFNQPGNFPGCDPASMACNFGFVTPYFSYYTYTYSALATSFYEVTATAQWTLTNQSTQTGYGNVPMYASLGLSEPQFLFIAALLLIMTVGVFAAMRRRGESLNHDLRALKQVCGKCGAKLVPDSKFCAECGSEIQPATTR